MGRRRVLDEDEDLVIETRRHPRALFWPGLLLILDAGLFGAGVAAVPDSYRPYGQWLVAAVCLVIALLGCLRPFLDWWTVRYLLTTRRFIVREGIFGRRYSELPLNRVDSVQVRRRGVDRVFGSGDLALRTVSGRTVTWPRVPRIAALQPVLSRLVDRNAPLRYLPAVDGYLPGRPDQQYPPNPSW